MTICCGLLVWRQEMEYGLLDCEPSVVVADPERVQRIVPYFTTTLAHLRGRVLQVTRHGLLLLTLPPNRGPAVAVRLFARAPTT
jgi:hypothetical protein